MINFNTGVCIKQIFVEGGGGGSIRLYFLGLIGCELKSRICQLTFWFYTQVKMFYLLGAFYFVLGNLRPQYRSVINIIQLVALFRTSLISTYGMDRILQPFMRDLNCLESVQYAILFFIIIK